MPAFPDVQKPAGKQNIFPKIPWAGSANLIYTHEILHKQCLAASTALTSVEEAACPIRSCKVCKSAEQTQSPCP